ncbi:hypothetical protein LPJ74_004637, partial [Coemansia sp. RSA 1843]
MKYSYSQKGKSKSKAQSNDFQTALNKHLSYSGISDNEDRIGSGSCQPPPCQTGDGSASITFQKSSGSGKQGVIIREKAGNLEIANENASLAIPLIREHKGTSLPIPSAIGNCHRPTKVPISDSAKEITLCVLRRPNKPERSNYSLDELVTLSLHKDLFEAYILAKFQIGNSYPGQLEVKAIVEGKVGSGRHKWRFVIPGELVGCKNAAAVMIGLKTLGSRPSIQRRLK